VTLEAIGTCERLAQGRYSEMRWPGVEPATCWFQVQRPNHYTTEPPCYTFFLNSHYLVDWKLTKREELLLRMVLALPYASSTGLACTIWSSSDPFFCKHIQTYIDSQWLRTKLTYSVQYEYTRNAPNLRAVITCHVDKKSGTGEWLSEWVGE